MKLLISLLLAILISTNLCAQRKYWELEAHNHFVLRKGLSVESNDIIKNNPNNYSLTYFGGSLSRNLICIGNFNFGAGLIMGSYKHRILDLYQTSFTNRQTLTNDAGEPIKDENRDAPLINPIDEITKTFGYGIKFNLKYRHAVNKNNNLEFGVNINILGFENVKKHNQVIMVGDQVNALTSPQPISSIYSYYGGYQLFKTDRGAYYDNYGALAHQYIGFSSEYVHMTSDRTSIGFNTSLNFSMSTNEPYDYRISRLITATAGISFRFYKAKYKKLDFLKDKHLNKDLFKRKR